MIFTHWFGLSVCSQKGEVVTVEVEVEVEVKVEEEKEAHIGSFYLIITLRFNLLKMNKNSLDLQIVEKQK